MVPATVDNKKEMAKQQPTKPIPDDTRSTQDSPWWIWLVSALLLLHLTAVIVPPLTMQTSNSPAVTHVMDGLAPYVDSAFLNHGYAFFAPNPPEASHLIKYRVEFNDGRPPVEHTFPDLERHWPRLLYHRHFMLSEQLRMAFVPPTPPPGATPEQTGFWRGQRDRYEARWNSFERHLLARHGGDQITMTRVLHFVPPPIVGEDELDLRDPRSYVELDENGNLVNPPSIVPIPNPEPGP